MPSGSSYQFNDQELGNLIATNINTLNCGGNVYPETLLDVAVTALRFTASTGFVDYAGGSAIAMPPSTAARKLWIDTVGAFQQGAAFPGTEHYPLAEVDTDAVEVVAIRDKRPRGGATQTAFGAGDVVGPAGATAGALPLWNGATGKLLQDSTRVPGAANGVATLDGAAKLPVAQLPGSVGDVTGPAGNTSNALAQYNGTTGKIIQDGPVPGAANGVATLDGAGKVPSSQLPSLLQETASFLVQGPDTLGNRPTKRVGASASGEFAFQVPVNYGSVISLVLLGIPQVAAAGAGKDIDIAADYAAAGETRTQHTANDTTTVYDLTGKGDVLWELDISGLFGSLAAGDWAGLKVTHNAIGGAIDYLGIRLTYNRA